MLQTQFRHFFWDNVFNNISHVFWCRVLMESLDREASRGLLELKVTKDPEDSQELQDPSDCRWNTLQSIFILNSDTNSSMMLWATLSNLHSCPVGIARTIRWEGRDGRRWTSGEFQKYMTSAVMAASVTHFIVIKIIYGDESMSLFMSPGSSRPSRTSWPCWTQRCWCECLKL